MYKRRLILVLGLVLLLALAALPAAAQNFPNPGTGSTITELANKTSTAATVRVKYYNQGGGDAGTVERAVPGNGSVKIEPGSTPLIQGFNGAGVASSDQPLAAVVETDWTGGPGDGFQMGYYSGVSAGSSAICFPSLWHYDQGGNSIISSFSVQNTGTSAAAVELSWTDRDGNSQGTFSDNIPVGAQHSYDLATSPGAYGAVPNLALDWAGSVKVNVTNGGTVAGVAVVSWGSSSFTNVARSATYNAADCTATGATTLVIPTHFRVKSGFVESGDWLIWSALNIQNLEGQPATATVEYIPRNPGDPSKTFTNVAIPANSTVGFNTRNGGDVAASEFTPLGANWSGTIKVTANRAIVGTVITQWNRGGLNEAGMYAAVNENGGGATKVFMPNVKRIAPGGNWQKWSAVIIQNLGASTANVDVMFYNRQGQLLLNLQNQSIPSGAALGYNTRNGIDNAQAELFNPLGTDYEGHVVVMSTNSQDLSVVLNGIQRSPGSGSGTTNGVPE